MQGMLYYMIAFMKVKFPEETADQWFPENGSGSGDRLRWPWGIFLRWWNCLRCLLRGQNHPWPRTIALVFIQSPLCPMFCPEGLGIQSLSLSLDVGIKRQEVSWQIQYKACSVCIWGWVGWWDNEKESENAFYWKWPYMKTWGSVWVR